MTVLDSRIQPEAAPRPAATPGAADHEPEPGGPPRGPVRPRDRPAADPARRQRCGGRLWPDRRHAGGRLRQRPQGAGRRHGHRGLRRDRGRPRGGHRAGRAGDRPVALGRCPAARGRREPARGRHRVRRYDQGLGRGAADLGGPRRRCGWRRLRARADRRGDPLRAGPDLRHRPRRGAQRDRRGRGHGPARRPRASLPQVRRGPRGRADRTPTRSSGPGNWPCCSATRAASTRAPRRRTARPAWAASCPSRPAAPTTSSR